MYITYMSESKLLVFSTVIIAHCSVNARLKLEQYTLLKKNLALVHLPVPVTNLTNLVYIYINTISKIESFARAYPRIFFRSNKSDMYNQIQN